MIYLYKFGKFNILETFEITLSNFTINLTDNESHNQSESEISINKKLLLYGLKSFGRLDIYIKCHILKQIISLHLNSIENVEANEFINSLNTLEKHIFHIMSSANSLAMNEYKYMQYVDIFIGKTEKKESLKELKKLFFLYQKVNDEDSLKICERLFIQLMGHQEKDIRNEAVRLLNMLYDESNWQENESFKDTTIHDIGDQFNLELILRENDFNEQNMILIVNCPSYNIQVPYNIISWNHITYSESIFVFFIIILV